MVIDHVEKMNREIDRIKTGKVGPQGYTYALIVNVGGPWKDVRGNNIVLKPGDIWKFGKTTMTERYSENELANMIPGGVTPLPLISGSDMEVKIHEKLLIYGYFFAHGRLPPGNRIFR